VGNDGNGSRHSGGGQATKNTATEKDTTSYVNAPFGLFPAPSHDVHAHMGGGMEGETSPFDSLYQTYVFLGRMFAFALVSDRTMDMTLSAPLRRAILHGGGSNLSSSSDLTRGVGSNINDTVTTASTALTSSVKEALAILENVDPVMCRHLTRFQHIAEERASMIAAGCVIDEKHPSLCVQGAPIEMLCLDFTLPGKDEFELRENGAEVSVTLENLGEYVQRVCQVMVLQPLEMAAKGIRKGMSSMFDPDHLRCFNEDELELLLCGTPAVWTTHDLHEHVRTNHGFSRDSIAVQQLLSILSEFQANEQRQFLKFVTGSPRLPVGGLGALRPSLTVVRKSDGSGSSNSSGSSSSGVVASSLPSASTCTHYLKLPEYSTKEEMREKLLLAISEGQGAFHLS